MNESQLAEYSHHLNKIRTINGNISEQLFGSVVYLLKYAEKYNVKLPKKEELERILFNAKPLLESHNQALEELENTKIFFGVFQQPTGNTYKTTDNETEPNFWNCQTHSSSKQKFSLSKISSFDISGRNNLGGFLPIQKRGNLVCYVFYLLESQPTTPTEAIITTSAVAMFLVVFIVSPTSTTSKAVFPKALMLGSVGNALSISRFGSGTSTELKAQAMMIAPRIVPNAAMIPFAMAIHYHFVLIKLKQHLKEDNFCLI